MPASGMACNNLACPCEPGCECGSGCPCLSGSVPSKIASRAASRYLEAREPALPDFWMTREEIASVCPPCADRMASLRIRRVLASAVFGQDMLLLAAERAADKWEGMPKGWTDESRKKFWKSVGESVEKCIEKLEGKVDDAGAFCASLKDRVERSTGWRGED